MLHCVESVYICVAERKLEINIQSNGFISDLEAFQWTERELIQVSQGVYIVDPKEMIQYEKDKWYNIEGWSSRSATIKTKKEDKEWMT